MKKIKNILRSSIVSGNNQEATSLKEKIIIEKKHKKMNLMKMILAIILSNAFIFLLMMPEEKIEKKNTIESISKDHHRIVIKANSLVPSTNVPTEISILDKHKKIIIEKAKLIKRLESSIEQSQFEIEIKADDSLKLAEQDDFILIPQISILPFKTKTNVHGDQNEIFF